VSVIVEGTQRVLELARCHPPRALLLLSSGAVYAPRSAGAGPLVEEDDGLAAPATSPGAAYGNAKRLCETLAAVAGERDGLRIKIARLFSFAGEHLPLDDQRAFGNLVRDAVAGEAVTLQGDGSAVRSYLYGADLALWLLAVLTAGAPLRPYNVGSDNAISLRQLATRVAAHLSPGEVLPVRCGSPGAATSSAYVPQIGRARRELGVEVWTDLDTCIRRTGQYARYLRSKASSCGSGS
jgi:dTDP-glucose 4,6-dehydratase